MAAGGVRVYAAGEESTRYTETADDGRFTVSGLHAGERYTLMINATEWSLDDALTLEAPTTGVLVTASRNHPLSGRIVDARGAAIGGVAVRVVHKKSGSSWMFATGDDGRFSIGGVPEGPCEVYVDARGEGNETLAGTVEAGPLDADLRVEN